MDNNKLISLEEARNILTFAKRIYKPLNSVVIEPGDAFAYYPNSMIITVPDEFPDEELGMRILEHVNEEFNVDFEYNLREMSIQALCHEMGHCLDFEGKIFTDQIEDYMYADSYNRMMFDKACHEFSEKVEEFNYDYEEYNAQEEVDEDIEYEFELRASELAEEDRYLDYLYRMIPTEHAADEFSARFFMTYLRGYKGCNYQVL